MKANNTTDKPINCRMDKSLLPQSKAVTRILEVTITAPQVKTAKSKPKLNLGLVIDRSRSITRAPRFEPDAGLTMARTWRGSSADVSSNSAMSSFHSESRI